MAYCYCESIHLFLDVELICGRFSGLVESDSVVCDFHRGTVAAFRRRLQATHFHQLFPFSGLVPITLWLHY